MKLLFLVFYGFAKKTQRNCKNCAGLRKTITKTFSCTTKSFVFTTKSFIYTAKSFSYSFLPPAEKFSPTAVFFLSFYRQVNANRKTVGRVFPEDDSRAAYILQQKYRNRLYDTYLCCILAVHLLVRDAPRAEKCSELVVYLLHLCAIVKRLHAKKRQRRFLAEYLFVISINYVNLHPQCLSYQEVDCE